MRRFLVLAAALLGLVSGAQAQAPSQAPAPTKQRLLLLSRHATPAAQVSLSLFASVHSNTINGLRAGGLYMPFAANVLPLTSRGVAVEPAATNLLVTSEGTGAFPTHPNATITSSPTIGPLGSAGFYATVTSTATSGAGQINTTVSADGTTYNFSFHIRKLATSQTAQIQIGWTGGTANVGTLMQFNLQTGAITLNASGTGQVFDGGDYWRVSLSSTNNGSNTLVFGQAYPVAGGTGAAEVGGLQLTASSFPSSYMQTTGSTYTRGVQTTSRTLEPGFGGAASTAIVSGLSAAGLAPSGQQTLYQIDDGTANNRITLYRDTSGNLNSTIVAGSVTQSTRSLGPLTSNTSLTDAISWTGTTASYRFNGAAPFIEYGVTIPTGLTTERIGNDLSGDQWSGPILSLTHYPYSTIAVPTFGDSFNRANTSAGDLGTPPSGVPYAVYGAPVTSHPAATCGQITSKTYTAPVNCAVYATQTLGGTVHAMSMTFSFASAGGSTGLTSPTMANSVNNLFASTAIHVQTSRASTQVDKVIAGVFSPILVVPYSPTLKLDGTLYTVSYTISGSTLTLTAADGTVHTVTDPAIATSIGPFIFFEQFNSSTDMVDLATVVNVSATQ